MPPKAKKRNANFNGNQCKKQEINHLDNASNEKVVDDKACELEEFAQLKLEKSKLETQLLTSSCYFNSQLKKAYEERDEFAKVFERLKESQGIDLIQKLEKEKEALKNHSNQLSAKNEFLNSNHDKLKNDYESLKSEHSSLKSRMTKLESKFNCSDIKSNNEKLTQKCQSLESGIENLTSQLAKECQKGQNLQDHLSVIEIENSKMKAKILQAENKTLNKNIFTSENKELKKLLNKSQLECQDLKGKMERFQKESDTRLKDLKSTTEELKFQIEGKEKALDVLKNESGQQIKSLEVQSDLLKKHCSGLRSIISIKDEEIQKLSEKLNTSDDAKVLEMKNKDQELENLNERNKDLKQLLEDSKKASEDLKSRLDRYENLQAECDSKSKKMESEMSRMEVKLKEKNQKIDVLEKALQSMKSQNEYLQKNSSDLKKTVSKKDDKIKEINRKVSDEASAMKSKNLELDNLKKKVEDAFVKENVLKNELHKYQNNINSLKETHLEEIRKLSSRMAFERDIQIKTLNNKLEKDKDIFASKHQIIKDLQAEIVDLKTKNSELEKMSLPVKTEPSGEKDIYDNEIIRLNELLNDKNNELFSIVSEKLEIAKELERLKSLLQQ